MRRTRSVKILNELNCIFDQLQVKEDTQFIWGGDFNVVFDTVLDADGGSPKLKLKSVSKLLSIMSKNDFCDIYGVRNPDTVRFTWRRKTPFKHRRLDLFLISDSLQENINLLTLYHQYNQIILLSKSVHVIQRKTQGDLRTGNLIML